MKKLILIRHAKSGWGNPDLGDIDRPLNEQGKKDASLIGKRLFQYSIQPDLILSSPAKRALKTAEIITKSIGYSVDKIVMLASLYTFDDKELLAIIREIDDQYQIVIIVGHNPGITRVAEYLTGFQIDHIPTCGIFCIHFINHSWETVGYVSGTLDFFDFPQKHHR